MSASIAAVIFDLDGLLLDSEPFWQRAESEVFRDVGVELTPSDLATTIGMRIDEVADHWLRARGWDSRAHPPHVVVERILTRVEALVRSHAVPLPGVLAAIRRFDGLGMRLALASSSPGRVIRAALATLGLCDRFEVIHSAEQEARGKPDPAVYLTTARRLGIAPDRCLALEDSVAGFRAARGAGMACVVVPDTRLRGHPDFAAAELVLDSLTELDDAAWSRLSARLS